MSHELETNIAIARSLGRSWHGMDNVMEEGATIEQWLEAGGLSHEVIKVPALAAFPDGIQGVADRFWLARKDNQHILSPGVVSNLYKIYQPKELGAFFADYVAQDPRFKIETALRLRQGDTIVMTAVFNGDSTVAGEKVKNRLLGTTTYDGSGATKFKPHTTAVVCNNTLSAALAEPQSEVSVRHNTQVKHELVVKQLAKIAQSYTKFKVMGDALAQSSMTQRDTVAFFRSLLDIPADAKKDEISARKLNIFDDLTNAYIKTASERNRKVDDNSDAWLALNAVTRFVDHNRSVRNTSDFEGGELEARFASALVGSGAQMKAKAWNLLMPRIKDLVAA